MDPPPPYTPLLNADSEVVSSSSDEKTPYAHDDGGESSTRYPDGILVADGMPPSSQSPADGPGETSTQLPPIPPAPEEPKMVDYSQIHDPIVRKVAEKEAERAWKRYEKAVKDRAKLVRDREKALGKIDKKENSKEEKEQRKEVRDAEKKKEREGNKRMKELRDIDREERRKLKTLKDAERENQRLHRDMERAEREKSKERRDHEAEKTQLARDQHTEKTRDCGRGRRDRDCKERRCCKNIIQQTGCSWKGQAPPGDENGQSSGIVESSLPSHSHTLLAIPPTPKTSSSD